MKVWDRFLDALLVLQVAASLVMSGFLAYRVTPELPFTNRPQVVAAVPELPQEVPDTLRPPLIWAYRGEAGYAGVRPGELAYEISWQQIQDVLSRSLAMPALPRPVSSLELDAAVIQPAVGVDLPLRLRATELVDLWIARDPSLLQGRLQPEIWPVLPVDRIVIGLGDPGGVYLLGPEGAFRLPLPFAARMEMERLAMGLTAPEKEAYRILRPGAGPAETGWGYWVLVPEGKEGRFQMPVLQVQWQEPRKPHELLPLFFPDQTVVREVEEPGGTRIYTDGRRALRVYSFGALEYTESQPGEADRNLPTPAQALRLAQEFVSARSLWLPGAVLTEMDQNRLRVRMVFMPYQNGLQTLASRPLLEMQVTGDRVTYLYAAQGFLSTTGGKQVTLISPEQAVEAAYAAREADLDRPGPGPVVYRVLPVYRLEPGTMQQLSPVWVIAFDDGSQVVVNGESGRVLP